MLSKVYDRVSWAFFSATLRGVGFFENLGDPLSPFLFILCMEVLSSNVKKAQLSGHLERISVCRNSPPLTHLFFADDSIFFLHDKDNACVHLRSILERFCLAFGQVMYEDKSGIIFSPSTKLVNARRYLRVLKFKNNQGIGKYLGVSTSFQGSKKDIFRELMDKALVAKLGWRLLSGENSLFSQVFGRKLFKEDIWVDGSWEYKGNSWFWGYRSVMVCIFYVRIVVGNLASYLNLIFGLMTG
ncbi:uncharacterized protein LOC141608055 [Silene latifolia]|uniref:uncharacterized protein LOC141608055 n=1 Tax=Silene latifolia TaxID=37657 RepID=UPI003D770335